jgi:hypothetical protein
MATLEAMPLLLAMTGHSDPTWDLWVPFHLVLVLTCLRSLSVLLSNIWKYLNTDFPSNKSTNEEASLP